MEDVLQCSGLYIDFIYTLLGVKKTVVATDCVYVVPICFRPTPYQVGKTEVTVTEVGKPKLSQS